MRWSYSTAGVLRRCHRQLAFGQVVASHNARDPLRREAFVLRQLQSVEAWQGSVIHQVLSTHALADLRANRPIDPHTLTEAARALARRQFAFSAARRYREPGMSKAAAGDAYCALLPHERGENVGTAPLDAVEENAARCFAHLAEQDELMGRLRAGYQHVAEAPLALRVDGISVAATPDLLVAGRDGSLTIVDWKVSRASESRHAAQLLLYALISMECGRWPGLSAADVALYEVNLLGDHVHAHRADADSLAATALFVRDGVAALRAVLGDGLFAHLDLGALDIAAEPRACAACPFAPLCVRTLTDAGRDGDAAIVRDRAGRADRRP